MNIIVFKQFFGRYKLIETKLTSRKSNTTRVSRIDGRYIISKIFKRIRLIYDNLIQF